MIKTYGLTHIALAVKDAERSLQFYQRVFGVVEVFREKGFIQAQTPGSRDVIVFEENAERADKLAASRTSDSGSSLRPILMRRLALWKKRGGKF